ncbi:MAG: sulfatase/phosphatase domain-containing protein [Verrucomicrobiales bacterium]
MGFWTKHTNYEQANRIPILIAAPGVTSAGSSTRQIAQSVDIFPTLAELAGLPAPQGPQPVDGISLVPALKDPAARVRDHAFHAYPRAKLGRAIRSERYRLVQWQRPGDPEKNAQYELYDYQSDPLERENLAAKNPRVMQKLKAILARYPAPFSKAKKRKQTKALQPGSKKIQTIEGIAERWKTGPSVHTGKGKIWIDLPDWPEHVVGKRVSVTGNFVERKDLPVFIDKPGEPVRAGIALPEGTDLEKARTRQVLSNIKWKLAQ